MSRRRLLTPSRELAQLSARSTELFVLRMQDLIAATYAQGSATTRNVDDATRGLAELFAATAAVADMLGRRRLLLELDARRGHRVHYAAEDVGPEVGIIPNVPFEQAISDMVDRDPRLAEGYKAVQAIYGSDYGFALAKSSSVRLTDHVQKMLATAFREGHDADDTLKTMVRAFTKAAKNGEMIRVPEPGTPTAKMQAFMQSYSLNVYRTNMATAYAAGRWKEALDPDVADEFPAFMHVAVMDADTRPNHAAGNGWIAATHDPRWKKLAVPIGYMDRCADELQSRDDLRAAGMLKRDGSVKTMPTPAGFHADDGFAHQHPVSLYGVR